MGALAPIANLIGFSTGGLGSGSQETSSTPPISSFFGLDSRFLAAPASSTALLNDVLFGSSSQQVPINFRGMGFYTGIPPLFGGSGFTGMDPRFDFFGGPTPASGLDSILALERAINGSQPTAALSLNDQTQNTLGLLALLLSGALRNNTGNAGSSGNAKQASTASKTSAKTADTQNTAPEQSAATANKPADIEGLKKQLKQLSMAELLQVLLT